MVCPMLKVSYGTNPPSNLIVQDNDIGPMITGDFTAIKYLPAFSFIQINIFYWKWFSPFTLD